jgi:hypothetical protein
MSRRGQPALVDVDAFGMKRFGKQTVRKSNLYDAKRICKAKESVGRDLANLLFDKATADVDLRLDNGTLIPAHRAILTARSPVFRAMLCGNMRESSEKQVHLSEIDELAMRSLLELVYTGTVDHFAEVSACGATSRDECECENVNLVGLACAADMYEIDALSYIEWKAENLESPGDYFDVLRRLPLGELGPAASCVKEICITCIADNFEADDFSPEDKLEKLAPKLLVEIMGRLKARLCADD